MVGEIQVQRRDRHVALVDGAHVGPLQRLPRGLAGADPVVRAPAWIDVLDDFVVRGRTAGTYTTAEKLKVNDSVAIKALRDADGNYIAQTIRLR